MRNKKARGFSNRLRKRLNQMKLPEFEVERVKWILLSLMLLGFLVGCNELNLGHPKPKRVYIEQYMVTLESRAPESLKFNAESSLASYITADKEKILVTREKKNADYIVSAEASTSITADGFHSFYASVDLSITRANGDVLVLKNFVDKPSLRSGDTEMSKVMKYAYDQIKADQR
jgi:hypothetical protein